MYTKVFRQIYDGTLADNWQALVTFQQLLILADANGVVDMTPAAIFRTTGIPLEIIEKGLAVLEAPDAGSRTPDMEGRRIVRIDEHRAWGWCLVNFRKYRRMVTKEEKNEADRQRMADLRAAEKGKSPNGVATRSDLSPTVADVAHTEAEAEAEEKELSSLRSGPTPLALTAEPSTGKPSRAARIREIAEQAQQAYNATLAKPHGELPLCAVLNRTRLKAVEKCQPTASAMCQALYGKPKITPEFWREYFEEVSKDDFHSGRLRGGPGHENWKPDFEFLLREGVMVKLFDRAMTEAAA